MENKNALNLSPEQVSELRKMVVLAKRVRAVFLLCLVVGTVISIVAAFLGESTAKFALYMTGLGIYLVAVICAVILFWNIRRIKAFCQKAGIKM